MDSQVPPLISFALWMQKKPYREATVRSTIACIKSIARKAVLDNPESVREYVAKATLSENRKCVLVDAAARYYNFKGIPFTKPIYRKIQKLPFIPLEREVDDLISGANKKTAVFLLLLKETGLRPGEAWALKWIDLDFERNCVTCTPEKNSNSRRLKISNRLISMINLLPRQSKSVFHNDEVNLLDSLIHFRRAFDKQRTRVAIKLQNPRIRQITFKTFRHYNVLPFHERHLGNS